MIFKPVMVAILKNNFHLEMYLYHSCTDSKEVNTFSLLYEQCHILVNTQKKIHMEMVVNGGFLEKWLPRFYYKVHDSLELCCRAAPLSVLNKTWMYTLIPLQPTFD